MCVLHYHVTVRSPTRFGVRRRHLQGFSYFTVRLFGATTHCRGTAVAQWLSFCATNRKVVGSKKFQMMSLESFINTILLIALWTWGRLSL